MQQQSLFQTQGEKIEVALGAYWLKGFCLSQAELIWRLVSTHLQAVPAQRMMTPMGHLMSVSTSSMGDVGWVSDQNQYQYRASDPITGLAWPEIPAELLQLACAAANAAGYHDFKPDTCLINLYTEQAKMGLHRDKDERDFSQPIVSVSLGMPAIFVFGGRRRKDPTVKCALQHGDVFVFGRESRHCYHGIASIKAQPHALLRALRCNLTFRKAQ